MELARGAPSLEALTGALEEDFPKEALGAAPVRELLAGSGAALELKVGWLLGAQNPAAGTVVWRPCM